MTFTYTLARAGAGTKMQFVVEASDRSIADLALLERLRHAGYSQVDLLYYTIVHDVEQRRPQ